MLTRFKNEAKKLRGILYHRLYTSKRSEKKLVEDFNKHYYDSNIFEGTWRNTYWLKVPTFKCPLDLWIYQEIIVDMKPDWIIETGTARGGSALYLASVCDLVGHGQVVSVDIEHKEGRPTHPRLRYFLGSSISEEILAKLHALIPVGSKVLVILDSDHSQKHVMEELKAYSGWVPKGGYLIVEDTIVNGHPVAPEHGPGPMEAVDEFLSKRKDFVIDASKEKLLVTFNPRGYLKRVE